MCKRWMEEATGSVQEMDGGSHRKCARNGWRKPQEVYKKWIEEGTGSVQEMDGVSHRKCARDGWRKPQVVCK